MDERGRDANSKASLEPHLKTIDRMRSKKDLSRLMAYLHMNFLVAWTGDDNSSKAPGFGFGPTQDLADAPQMVAGLDQGGGVLGAEGVGEALDVGAEDFHRGPEGVTLGVALGGGAAGVGGGADDGSGGEGGDKPPIG